MGEWAADGPKMHARFWRCECRCCCHAQVMPFILRRTKDAVLKDLPPKILQVGLSWGSPPCMTSHPHCPGFLGFFRRTPVAPTARMPCKASAIVAQASRVTRTAFAYQPQTCSMRHYNMSGSMLERACMRRMCTWSRRSCSGGCTRTSPIAQPRSRWPALSASPMQALMPGSRRQLPRRHMSSRHLPFCHPLNII